MGSPPLIGVEVVRGDEYVRRAKTSTLHELIGATEAAGMLKVTRQRVNQLAAEHGSFPAPVLRVRMGSLWAADAVRAFARTWTRAPGRPRQQQPTDLVRTTPCCVGTPIDGG